MYMHVRNLLAGSTCIVIIYFVELFICAGESFPWRRLGYSSMISMLQAMPEAVHFEYSNKDGDYKLHGVGDSKSFFMPSWVLKTQGEKMYSS